MGISIVQEPDPVLRSIAKPVSQEEFDTGTLKKILDDMARALRSTSDGIGIAAPQIGVSKRIFLASEEALALDRELENADERFEKKSKGEQSTWKYHVYINPEILKISTKKQEGAEGCLSIMGTYGKVARADKIKVRAYDEHGKMFETGATKLFARLLQHEIDHLNGVLFIDKAKDLHTITAEDNE